MRQFVFLLFILLLFSQGFSQKYLPGYALELNGDTIYGELLLQNHNNASEKCIIKNQSGELLTFLPQTIAEYRFYNGDYYVSKSIKVDNVFRPVFLKLLMKGTVELYFFNNRTKKNEQFFIMKNDTLIELENNEKKIIIDGIPYLKYDNKYLGTLKYLFSDAPEIIPKINKIKFDPNELIKISEDYHNHVCKDVKCQVFTGNPRRLYIGLKPKISYDQTKIDIKQTHLKVIEQPSGPPIELYKETINEYKSNYSYLIGLGFFIIGPEKRLKFEYSYNIQYITFSNTNFSGEFPLDEITFYETPLADYNLNLTVARQIISLSYSFSYWKLQPTISGGVTFGKIKKFTVNDNSNIKFPDSMDGLYIEAGARYNIKNNIIVELNGYYSYTIDSQGWSQVNFEAYNGTEIDTGYSQFGINLGFSFILF